MANGYLYVMAGENSAVTQSINYYAKLNTDGSTGAWNTTSSLPAARRNFTSVVSNGYIYAIGGDNSGSQSTVYYAKLNTNGTIGSWSTAVSSLPAVRSSHVSVIVNGYVYVIGGNDGAAVQATVYYGQTSRVYIGASLDLIGMSNGTLTDPGDSNQGSPGGSITAGNGVFVGNLQVQGQGSFAQGISVGGNSVVGGSALFQNSANSTTAFQIQNALGSSALGVDTTPLNGILTNQSFENSDVSAWTYSGTPGSVSRSTTEKLYGSASLQVITTANANSAAAARRKLWAKVRRGGGFRRARTAPAISGVGGYTKWRAVSCTVASHFSLFSSGGSGGVTFG